MIRSGKSARFTPTDVEEFRQIGLDLGDVRHQDDIVRSDRSGAGRVHLTGSAGESLPWAEQRAYDRLRIDRTLWSKRTAEQNADRSMRIDLACCRHGALLQEKKGNTRPRCGRTEVPRSGYPRA